MNYYISDLHLSHENIMRFDKRPYDDITEMNEDLIKRWNSVVTKKDTVYILGDFCWQPASKWPEYLKRMNGKKVLIKGNHDPRCMSDEVDRLFQGIYDFRVINDGEYEVVMSHYPLLFYPKAFSPKTIMLCGHVHITAENDALEKWRNEMRKQGALSYGRIINVGCMMPYMDYTPRTLKEILERTGL